VLSTEETLDSNRAEKLSEKLITSLLTLASRTFATIDVSLLDLLSEPHEDKTNTTDNIIIVEKYFIVLI